MKSSNQFKKSYLFASKDFSWIIVLTIFVLFAFSIDSQFFPDLADILNSKIFNYFQYKSGDNSIQSKLLFIFSINVIPFLFICIWEILINFPNINKNLRNTSVGRLVKSEGYNFADIIYFSLYFVLKELPLIVGFLTLGISRFGSFLSNWFHTIVEKLVPTNISEFSIIFIIIGFLIGDLAAYWSHRIAHRIPIIWDQHEFHHSATEMTIFNKDRASLLEGALTSPIVFPLSTISALLINESLIQGHFLPLLITIVLLTFEKFCDMVGHSSICVIFPKPLSYIYMSPSLHWIHHSNNIEHFDKNFGQRFPFWDKIFGTYLDESHIKNIDGFGVSNTTYNNFNPFYAFACLPVLKLIQRFKFIYT